MKFLTFLFLAGLVYGGVRFLLVLSKELKEIAAEAWHSGETGS